MNERDLQCLFRNWLKANWQSSAAFELKICKEKSFNLKKIADHQIANLNMAHYGLFSYKLPDLGLQNPFDCFTLWKVESYIIIFFYRPRQKKIFYIIPVTTIQGLIDDGIKSIDEPTANKLVYKIGELK